MGILDHILSYRKARDATPPEPAAPDRIAAARTAVGTALTALHQRILAQQQRERERQRILEEARRRREAEEAARPAASVPSEEHAPRYQIGSRCNVESLMRADIMAAMDELDPRAFSRHLLRAVRKVYGGNPVPFYTAAGLSRSAYSKIISHPDRHPSKDTVLAMSAALKMNLPAAEGFLRLAGYALSDSIPSDIVWRACLSHGIHHLPQILDLLAEFTAPHPKDAPPTAE